MENKFYYNEEAYSGGELLTVRVSNDEKSIYLMLPCATEYIESVLTMLGATDLQEIEVSLDDISFESSEWIEKFKDLVATESLYDINKFVEALNSSEMDLHKLSAVIEYAEVADIESMTKLAKNIDSFIFIPEADDTEAVGRYCVDNFSEYSVHPVLEDFINYSEFGEYIQDEYSGAFVERGFVALDELSDLDEILGDDEKLTFSGYDD